MKLLASLRPPRLPRRSSDPHSSLPFQEPSRQTFRKNFEKYEPSDEDDYSSEEDYDSASPRSPITSSSRETSGSYDSKRPMIHRRMSPRTIRRNSYRIPQK